MNKTIKKQLQKVTVANLGVYDDNTKCIYIPKFEKDKFDVGNCYTVKLDSTLLSPMYNTTLVSNWNRGSCPPCEYLKVDVIKVLGKMINVNAIGYDFNNKQTLSCVWSGWLPVELIKKVERL